MIGGIVGVLTLVWVYQTAYKANVQNVVMWVIICGVIYLASQFILVGAANYMVEGMRGGGTEGYERDLTSIGDRKNMGGFQGGKGTFMSVFFEIFPPIAGFLLVAVTRLLFVLKQPFNKDNLFSGVADMFRSIKESFKNPDQQ